MKLVIDKSSFVWAVDKINKIIPSHPKLPTLTNLHLTAKKPSTLIIEATDLEIGERIELKTKVEEDGDVLVNGRFLADAIHGLVEDNIHLITVNNTLQVQTKGVELEINITTKDDYPVITWPQKELGGEKINSEGLTQILSKVAFSVSRDEIRPILMGVFFDKGDEVVTTDGVRLSVYKPSKSLGVTDTVLPLGFLRELADLGKENIEMLHDIKKKRVIARAQKEEGEFWLQTQVIEGDFPKYKEIIPQDFKVSIVVDKDKFLQQLRTVMVVAKSNGNLIKMKVDKKEVILMAESSTYGSARGEMVAEIDGVLTTVMALNGKFLQEAVSVIDDNFLAIKLNSNTSPLMLRGVENDDFYHILMPINLQE